VARGATARVYVVGDAKGFHTVMRRATWEAMAFQEKMVAIGAQLRTFGRSMTYGVTLPVLGGMALSVKAASDLGESVSKVNVVFGESAAAVQEWSKTTAASMGQSRAQSLEAAGTFGNLFKTMGMGQGEAAKMSIKLTGLASDLASFNNISPTEALDALRSGLVGEAEPMRRLGVLLSENEVKQQAYKMGLAETGAVLTEQQKVQARYALVLAQTTTAQGDFARTSDGLANKTRILKAQLTDAGATIGTALIPVVQKAAGVISNLANKFNGMSDGQKKLLVGVGLLAAALGPLMSVMGRLMQSVTMVTAAYRFLFVAKVQDGIVTRAGAAQMAILQVRMLAAAVATKVAAAAQWLWNAAMSANPIGLVIAAIAALVAIFVVLYKKNQTFRSIVNAVWGAVKAVVSAVIGVIVALFKRWWAAMQTNIGIMRALWGAAVSAFGGIKSAIGAVVNAIQWLWDKFSWLRGLVAGLHIPNPFSALLSAIQSIISAAQTAYGWLKKLGSQKGPGVGVHYGQGRALGGPTDGPRSGYPVILHGRETVVAHNNPSRGLADLFGAGIIGRGAGMSVVINLNGSFDDGADAGAAAAEAFARRTRELAWGY
jgi:hypothetical protein